MNRRPRRWVALTLLLLIACAVAALLLRTAIDPRVFPMRSIKIYGDYTHVNKNEIERVVAPLVRESFFDADITIIRDELLQLPWVKTAWVKRVWPNTLVIYLRERQPMAIWNREALLSDEGYLIASATDEFINKLPLLTGSFAERQRIIQQYKVLEKILSTKGLHIRELRLTSDGLWVLRTQDGMVVMLGAKEVEQRLARFVAVYSAIVDVNAPTLVQPRYVDLRYSDGVAVKW